MMHTERDNEKTQDDTTYFPESLAGDSLKGHVTQSATHNIEGWGALLWYKMTKPNTNEWAYGYGCRYKNSWSNIITSEA